MTGINGFLFKLSLARKATTFCFFLLTLCFSMPCWAVDQAGGESVADHGERMYREGVLPSGKPLKASIEGNPSIPGTTFSCVGCHLRSGIGSIEESTLSPPVSGNKLYKPYYQHDPVVQDYSKVRKTMWEGRGPVKPIFRPAFTDETLAVAISKGISPTGRVYKSVMPRYELEAGDMAILISYLKSLSSEVSPGVDKQYKYIRFATVIAGDVPTDDRNEMLSALNAIIEHHNINARKKNRRQNLGATTREADFNYPMFTLARWELRGPESSWPAQLENYYRKEPVFALLGGISVAGWSPIHEFCERNRIPGLLPITDLPVISDFNWYTLYFTKGIYQEGDAVARYLAGRSEHAAEDKVLQVVEDSPLAREAANGYSAAWKELGRGAAELVLLKPGEQISYRHLKQIAEQKNAGIVMLWTSAGTISALEEFTASGQSFKNLFVSSTLLRKELWSLPEKARGFTYISYPYRLDTGNDLYTVNSRSWLKKRAVPVSDNRISSRLFTLTNVLLEPFVVVKRDFNPNGLGDGLVTMENQYEMLMHVKRNYFRDYLMDLIGMFSDRQSIDYERLSFGPNQRYISKGCYIVQLAPGLKPELIKRNDWLVH